MILADQKSLKLSPIKGLGILCFEPNNITNKNSDLVKMDWDTKHLEKINASWLKHFLYASYFNFLALLIFITGLILSLIHI